jgi:hypothetical protein
MLQVRRALSPEPGGFRTDFLDPSSMVFPARTIEDYASTAGELRDWAGRGNHKQLGCLADHATKRAGRTVTMCCELANVWVRRGVEQSGSSSGS